MILNKIIIVGCFISLNLLKQKLLKDSEKLKITLLKIKLLYCRILNTQNYYSMLECQEDATLKELSEAYKRIALQIHPDKNSSPKSTEAFKSNLLLSKFSFIKEGS